MTLECTLVILVAIVNVCLGLFVGYIRGITRKRYWTEEIERHFYMAGFKNGIFFVTEENEKDEDADYAITINASMSYDEYKGYPHNRKH